MCGEQTRVDAPLQAPADVAPSIPARPDCFVTYYSQNSATESTQLSGNFPKNFRGTRNFCWHANLFSETAMYTCATPTIFAPFQVKERFVDMDGHARWEYEQRADGSIEASCPAQHTIRLANELQAGMDKPKFIEALVSIGTGRPAAEKASTSTKKGPSLKWTDAGVERMLALAEEAERIWEKDVLAGAEMRKVPMRDVMRINPPELGALDPFFNKSLPELSRGMKAYFDSAQGRHEMEELYHLVFAKLWQVKLTANFIAGATAVRHQIHMRERLTNFEPLEKCELKDILSKRGRAIPADEGGLQGAAEAAFEQQPFVPMVEGHFIIRLMGEEPIVLAPGVREFELKCEESGLPLLDVVWRTKHGDELSITGFPRTIRVTDPA